MLTCRTGRGVHEHVNVMCHIQQELDEQANFHRFFFAAAGTLDLPRFPSMLINAICKVMPGCLASSVAIP